MSPRSCARRWLLLGLSLLCLGPTPGDVGGCGQNLEDLDAEAFFAARRQVDCDACRQCGLSTRRCTAACEGEGKSSFPELCYPLVHDGEVCLRALRHSSCDDYRGFVSDVGATVPTECDFCPAEQAP